MEVCPYSYFRWCKYFQGPWVSFVSIDEFSVRITKITSRTGVFFFFFLSGFSFTTIHDSQDCRRREEGISLTPHYPFHPLHRQLVIYSGDYCRKLTSAHRQQPYSNGEPLVSERKSPTTKLCALKKKYHGKLNIDK